MRILRVLVLLSLTAAAGCVTAAGESGTTGAQSPALGQPVTLKPGDKAVFDAERLQIRFDRVVSDSRCPKDAQCVWAGEAVIRLTVTLPDASIKSIDVKASPTDKGTAVGTFGVSVNDLQPLPTVNGAVRDADYRVTLTVAKG